MSDEAEEWLAWVHGGRRRVGSEGTWGAGCSVISGFWNPRSWDGEGWAQSFLGVGSHWTTACRFGGDLGGRLLGRRRVGSEFPQRGLQVDDGVSVWRGLGGAGCLDGEGGLPAQPLGPSSRVPSYAFTSHRPVPGTVPTTNTFCFFPRQFKFLGRGFPMRTTLREHSQTPRLPS